MQKWLSFIKKVAPPREWLTAVAVTLGILVGIIIVIFRISNATSYLSDDPKVCINCHVMFPQYETWSHSSHREKVSCNECHVPHDSIIKKYLFKAEDGLRHATIYTLRKEPQVIHMKEAGQAVVQANCIRCHQSLLEDSSLVHADYDEYLEGEMKLCWACHRETAHGRTRSLAATGYYHVPQLDDPVPSSIEFLRDFLENIMESKEKNNE